MKSNVATFAVSAVLAVGGALMTLDWSAVVSPQTAGVVVMLLGGAVAFARVLLGNTDKAE